MAITLERIEIIRKMRKIAIVHYEDRYVNYDDSETFVKSITDWTEVDEETYQLLKRHQFSYLNGEAYYVVTRPVDEQAFIKQTVAEYIEHAKKEDAKKAAEKKKREDAALQRKLKKQAKDAEARKAMYEQLQKEFGNE